MIVVAFRKAGFVGVEDDLSAILPQTSAREPPESVPESSCRRTTIQMPLALAFGFGLYNVAELVTQLADPAIQMGLAELFAVFGRGPEIL